jgi:cytochrome c oxidase cbb3-type subunit I/II
MSWHRDVLENKSGLFAVASTLCIAVGGIVEIVPMYSAHADPPEGIDPYTPLEVAGRDIYVREGCYNCHSQMVRPMQAETLRYGQWTRAEEYTYDRPFQLGSRRIGPDLQRVGGKYPDAWHWEHLRDPRSTTPGSLMPSYSWLHTARVDPADVTASVQALATLGTPYEGTDLGWVTAQLDSQAAPIASRIQGADPGSEAVALIAFLQRLGTDGRARLAQVAP